MSLLTSRLAYRPMAYPWAYDYWRKQQQVHWMVDEIPMHGDVKDWTHVLSPGERNLLTQLFRFFVQGDVDVATGYLDKIIPSLGGQPEIKMMLASFANMETVHIDAYDKLMQTIGMPDGEYTAFNQFKEMSAKHDYINRFDTHGGYSDDPEHVRNLIQTLAVYSAFTEGLQLFSSFAILLNFARFKKMLGMCKVVEWSIRDETLHCEAMCRLTRQLIEENHWVWTDDFKATIYQICRTMVDLEDGFIDLCFREAGEIEGLTPTAVKRYIRYIADRRLHMLGLKANYGAEGENLDWIDWMLGEGHSNFFETRETEYSKGIDADWNMAW